MVKLLNMIAIVVLLLVAFIADANAQRLPSYSTSQQSSANNADASLNALAAMEPTEDMGSPAPAAPSSSSSGTASATKASATPDAEERSTASNPGANYQYKLGSGDKIRLKVFGEDDLSGDFLVDGSGTASLPLIGEVPAKGLTPRELERAIRAKLSAGYLRDPKVTIEVISARPFFILGEVNKPGSYPYVDGMTVLNAVALAGGFTYRASERAMTVTRAGDQDRKEQTAMPDDPLFPGDIVRVPERFF